MEAFNKLKEILSRYDSVAIAYSGGVDSSFLMAVAVDVLGPEHVVGVYAESELHPRREKFDAYVLAEMRNWKVKMIPVDIEGDESVLENGRDRCYHCKRATFRAVRAFAEKKGYRAVLDGTNADDAREYRPGTKALEELGIASPLLEAGLGKEDVRKLSKSLYDLPTWNKPSNSCLATRIPYGERLTREKLLTVEQGEAYLHELGYLTCRMRLHGDVARVEIPFEDFEKFLTRDRKRVAGHFRELGILHTALDVLGFRSGSGDETLEDK
ncbi:MAG: ATP-dependent sacrificial sulfur transferase LarE [Peptoniphilus sp.]|nr:ATP-dependent sacrificial sulfur transferase LarE [Peptoniphilus sp.]MDY6045125.1 ATP-dependent sacrificial sulfur transferase LarE [Peptoniphilus sp.]